MIVESCLWFNARHGAMFVFGLFILNVGKKLREYWNMVEGNLSSCRFSIRIIFYWKFCVFEVCFGVVWKLWGTFGVDLPSWCIPSSGSLAIRAFQCSPWGGSISGCSAHSPLSAPCLLTHRCAGCTPELLLGNCELSWSQSPDGMALGGRKSGDPSRQSCLYLVLASCS